MNVQNIRLGILECGEVRTEIREQFGTSVDWFKLYLSQTQPGTFDVVSYKAYLGEMPVNPEDCDAWLLTGSVHSVLDRAAWMTSLKTFVREASKTQKIIGVCFGHQLIAEAFGGKVEKAQTGWQVGLQRYSVQAKPDWMMPDPDAIALVASHQDQVIIPPDGAIVVAGNESCPFGMMQIGPNILTIQLHPEMTKECSKALTELRVNVLGSELVAEAYRSLEEERQAQVFADWIKNFLIK
jgi:GMP synthase-like glutamine amidotransferase